MAEGTPMDMVRIEKANAEYGLMPLMNMWWPQTMKPRKPMRHDGVDHRLVAEDRLARERRQHLRSHAHAGQDGDVDLGMSEEPEQMLPQQRRAALVAHDLAVHHHQRNVEAGAEVAIEQQQDAGRKQHAERQQSENRGDEP